MNPQEKTIGIFAGFPPEHNAHVIEAVMYVRALQEMQFKSIVGLSCSESRGKEESLTANLDTYGAADIIDPLPYPDISILNLHEFCDGYDIQSDAVAEMIESHRIDVCFLTYYPLFGQQFIDLLKKMRKHVILITKIPLVQSGQDSIFAEYHRGYEETIAAVDTILAYQQSDLDLVEQYYPTARGKAFPAHKFVDQQLLSAARNKQDDVLQKYGLDNFFLDAQGVVGLIGRTDPEKNVIPFVQEIWPKIATHSPKAKLLIVGKGTQEQELQSIVENMPNIYFLNQSVPYIDILALLKNIDVLAATSGTDYTPRIPMDALLMGTRVVANDLNFNNLFRKYSSLVPVSGFSEYSPYGYNDNSRTLGDHKNQKSYGVPDSSAFADSVTEALTREIANSIPKGVFKTNEFIGQFLHALKSSS